MGEAPPASAVSAACRQALRGVSEEVAGARGEGMNAGRPAFVSGRAKSVCQHATRKVVDASSPQDRGGYLNAVRAIGKFNHALETVGGYFEADPETIRTI